MTARPAREHSPAARPPREALPGSTALHLGAARPERSHPPSHALQRPDLPHQQVSFASSDTSEAPQYPAHPGATPRVRIRPEPERIGTDSSRAQLIPPTPPPHDRTNLGGKSSQANVARKKSLVRPDRARLDETDRLYNYRAHAAQMEADGRGIAGFSSTGHYAAAGLPIPGAGGHDLGSGDLRRGKSILAREEGGRVEESGLSMFKRGATLRRPTNRASAGASTLSRSEKQRLSATRAPPKKEPMGPWMLFCLTITVCFPAPVLNFFGLRTKERQSAWREKMGLLVVITISMAAVGFLTFGFTKSVCGTPALRYRNNHVEAGSMIYHGYDYDFDSFKHPAAAGIEGGSNPLYNLFDAAGKDGSFLFQTVNERCLNVITPAAGTGIPTDGNKLGWYFPCNLYNQYGTSPVNLTGYAAGALCHTQTKARRQFAALKPLGQVYFTWEDLKNSSRNLGVYDGAVLDFNLLNWLDRSQVSYPALFDQIKGGNESYTGRDITALMVATNNRKIADCMVDTLRVGFIDSVAIGCVASDVVLYVSLVVIIGVVMLRFGMAVFFGWFYSWRIGKFPNETYAQRMARSAEIEDWTNDIYRPAPARYRPSVKPQKKAFMPTTSRFSKGDLLKPSSGASGQRNGGGAGGKGDGKPPSMYGFGNGSSYGFGPGSKPMLGAGMRNSPPDSPGSRPHSRSSSSLPLSSFNPFENGSANVDGMMGSCPFPLGDVVPQPPADFEPFNYPLLHSFLLVTAYSESVEGLRTTLDSLATTDYPNSHKVILVIADGMVKGAGNDLTTPEIVLGMMKEFVVQPEDTDPLSYLAIADGHKRHNRAKVFAGFYEYDNNTVEMSKQQRVPMMLIAKVGNEQEANDPKPGNRGKRDSQIMLMAFLQKVMFDERMSTFEYEFFNLLWRCTGVSPDRYETVLCVDADTKVFPDSLSRMVSCMVHDTEIMGLCGETKVANKSDTWVTMMQVFEYYSAHHLSKAFESVFGGVTCLPGCFTLYRIKAPKGGDGYWVPILANPDIVEHYSENVVDTLHKKNLLLLGEDRYLTTLMLRTFPRRKMMFCPQAVCKTIVPDTFAVLLSQRRRWINSTVHNLFELILVPDLCGVFCFSMRFVIFMELAGTLVLPAAIAFTLYLIIISIIPGTVKPIISLVLLAIILGIPGLLIVLTSRKISYIGWMMIYLMSLPIWNFVLPMYSFLHMDDFSWGTTRKIAGDGEGGDHGDKDGNFDSSNIVMKRWAEFERDRRYRSGIVSRDSTYDILRHSSPDRNGSNRYSMVSSVETFQSGPGGSGASDAFHRRSSPAGTTSENHAGPRYPTQLELPAPLAARTGASPGSSSGSLSQMDAGPDVPSKVYDDRSARLAEYPRYADGGYESDDLEREAILGNVGDSPGLRSLPSNDFAPFAPSRVYPGGDSFFSEPETLAAPIQSIGSRSSRSQVSSPDGGARSESVASHASNPFATPDSRSTRDSISGSHRRGVSLVDDGPVHVPGSQGFRVVQRARRTSQGPTPPAPRTRTSTHQADPLLPSSPVLPTSPSLPPGAAPPRNAP